MKEFNFSLPSPQALIREAKEETISVSLRVKESTVASFDKMAKEVGVNRGAMMNAWLDFYAQNYTSFDNDNSKDIMISYLNSERFWKIIPSLTAEELIYRMKNKGIKTPRADDAPSLFSAYRCGDCNGLFALIESPDNSRTADHICADSIVRNFTNNGWTDLSVTLEQWPLVVVLLSEYTQKYKKLFPEHSFAITPKMYDQIALACRQYSTPDGILATAIKNILLDFVEKQND